MVRPGEDEEPIAAMIPRAEARTYKIIDISWLIIRARKLACSSALSHPRVKGALGA